MIELAPDLVTRSDRGALRIPSSLEFRPYRFRRGSTNELSNQLLQSAVYQAYWTAQDMQRLKETARSHMERYALDSRLSRHVSAICPGYGLEHLPLLVHQSLAGTISFDDSWSLLSWSRWWVRRGAELSSRMKPMILLHLDDHADLGDPLILCRDCQWLDALTGRYFSFGDSESIAAAIESGAVGIGSFVTPMLHAVEHCDIRHLSFSQKTNLQRFFGPDLAPCGRGFQRMSLREVSQSQATIKYMRTDVPEDILRDLPPEVPVLLHIDLDCFNNRYDVGDNGSDPDSHIMAQRIWAFFAALREALPTTRIENVAIALSPGFCPSEHWTFLLEEVLSGLAWAGYPSLTQLQRENISQC